MKKTDKILLGLIGILVIAVLILEFIPVQIAQESAKKVTYTPAKETIDSSAVTSAYIAPDLSGAAKVTVNIK